MKFLKELLQENTKYKKYKTISNEQLKKVQGIRNNKLYFSIIDGDSVTNLSYKDFMKSPLPFKDNRNAEDLLKTLLKKMQFNTKVDYNIWAKKILMFQF